MSLLCWRDISRSSTVHGSQCIKTSTALSALQKQHPESNPVGSPERICPGLSDFSFCSTTTGVWPCPADDDVMRLKRAKTDASLPSTNRWTTWLAPVCALACLSPRPPGSHLEVLQGMFVVPSYRVRVSRCACRGETFLLFWRFDCSSILNDRARDKMTNVLGRDVCR